MVNIEKRDPQTHEIIGACMEIHRQLGHGFLEPVYQEAAVIEFASRNIPSEREVILPVQYKNRVLATGLKRGLLFNFGTSSLQYKRLVWNYHDASISEEKSAQLT